MYTNIPPQLWMMASPEIRQHLAKVFGLKRTGITEVRDSEVITDGYSVDDLRAITLEKMVDYVGSTESFSRAWEVSCAKAKYELHPPIMEIKTGEVKTVEGEAITGETSVSDTVTLKKVETKNYDNKKSK